MEELEKHPIGTKVRIRKDSEYYMGNNLYNPKDTLGEIFINDKKGDKDYCYRVQWPSDKTNCYRHIDLELEEPVITNIYPIY